MDENVEKFVAELAKSISEATFVKLILSNYKGEDRQLQKISVRSIETKKGGRLMFQSRFETRDVVKNFSFEEAGVEIVRHLVLGFRSGHLFTTENDFQLEIGKRNSRLKRGNPTFTAKPPSVHDHEKARLIDPNAYYLKALGISTDDGRIKASQQDKWRQINKFVEILASLVDASPIKDKPDLKIIDMGSGKGYLTFAAYDYFANIRPAPGSPPYKGGVDAVSADGVVLSDAGEAQPELTTGSVAENHPVSRSKSDRLPPLLRKEGSLQMTGVEQRPELVDLCSDIAKAGGYDNLKFVEGRIADFDPGRVDILIALHACDTATDDALFKGIAADASIIVAAPCCHKELRKQITPPEMLAGILKHGIMLERTAETITDGLRSLLLEREGYATKLFEFVATEHTPKNNMLVATKKTGGGGARSPAASQIDQLKSSFGIAEQRLEKLLADKGRTA